MAAYESTDLHISHAAMVKGGLAIGPMCENTKVRPLVICLHKEFPGDVSSPVGRFIYGGRLPYLIMMQDHTDSGIFVHNSRDVAQWYLMSFPPSLEDFNEICYKYQKRAENNKGFIDDLKGFRNAYSRGNIRGNISYSVSDLERSYHDYWREREGHM